MRLLKVDTDGAFSLVKHSGNEIPCYAILSHTWGADNDEVSFEDVMQKSGQNKSGYKKLVFCQRHAAADGLQYFWVDTCCIDKSSSQELSESINSMFRWYERSTKCYVYLPDVSTSGITDHNYSSRALWTTAFAQSRWFTRGWTLQELLAPKDVEFFSKEDHRLGSKLSLDKTIHEITDIPSEALQGKPLWQFSVDERMGWAKSRNTGREEDIAYCLLGIFGVTMILNYSEGRAYAFRRLEEEIEKSLDRRTPIRRQRSMYSIDGWSELPSAKRPRSEPLSLSNHELSPDCAPQDPHPGLTSEQREALLESLKFEQMDSRRLTMRNAHQKTCKWLLEKHEYITWLDHSKMEEHHGFLWIKGKAGCGKSTLMKFAAAHATKAMLTWTIASFFFNARGVELERSTMGMYRSLLVQIFARVPALRKHLDSAEVRWLNPSSSHQWTRESLKSLLLDVIEGLGNERVICFIDALDESDEDEIRDMVSFFEHIGQRALDTSIRFLVCFSSRYYPNITIAKSIPMELDAQEGHTQDITKYLQSELKIGKSKAADQIRQEVQRKASGIFLWVVLVKEKLNKTYDRGRIHELRLKLQETPEDLHELFRDMLTRDSQNQVETILCIQWVLFAKQPLRPEQLYFAILAGSDPESLSEWDQESEADSVAENFLIDSSKGLTEITRTKAKTVQFIHESVRDFFLKENGLGRIWSDLSTDFECKSHDKLKQCCWNYLNQDLTNHWNQNIGHCADWTEETTNKLRDSVRKAFPLLEYASKNLLYHSDTAAEKVPQAEFIRNFPMKLWAPIYNLFEKFKARRYHNDVGVIYMLAERNLPQLLHAMISKQSPLETSYGRYRTPLFAAIAMGNAETARALLTIYTSNKGIKDLPPEFFDTEEWRGNFDMESKISPGRSVWSHLDVLCHPEICRLFLSDRPAEDIDMKRGCQERLEMAVSKRKWKFLTFLLDGAADSSARGMNFDNCLVYVAEKGNLRLVNLLLDKGANVNGNINYRGRSPKINPLQAASYGGHEKTIRLLLVRGADVNAQGGYYGNALLAASSIGHEEAMRLLLDRGADVNAQGGIYGNALQAAAFRAFERHVQLLLDRGANVNTQGGLFGNALQAASYKGHTQTIRLLLDKGADVNAQGGEYCNALNAAVHAASEESVRLLLDRGADVNWTDSDLGNILQVASHDRSVEMVRLLLDRGANVNARGGRYGNALQAALVRGNASGESEREEIVQLLTSRGASTSEI